jgi:hypothetical protein
MALIVERQADLGITDEQLALALGYDSPTVVNMLKQGMIKMPVQKISALALALSLDPAHLLRLHLSECMPDVLAAVDSLLAAPTLTANEKELIESYRRLTKGQDVRPVVVDGNSVVALIVA